MDMIDALHEMKRPTKTDRRSRRTRRALTVALMELLNEKPLRSITVTEITKRADTNRATFYLHFQDVYDMFDQVRKELRLLCEALVDMHAKEVANNDFELLLRDIYELVYDNRSAFATVFSSNSEGTFLGEMTDALRDRCIEIIAPLERFESDHGITFGSNRAQARAICHYQFDYVAGGAMSMMKDWIAGGYRESPEFMAGITWSLIRSSVENEMLPKTLGAIARKEES